MEQNQTESDQAHRAGGRSDPNPLPFKNRRCDPARTYFRGGRYFTVGHEWFVTLREGRDMGPYLSPDAAELAVARQVAENFLATPGGVAELFGHAEAALTPFEVLVRELLEGLQQRQLRSETCAYVWVKQRLDTLREDPTELSHPDIRSRALRYLLDEFEN